MTLSSDLSYSIADLRTLLSQRVGLELSPIELAEILWLALQRGEVDTDELKSRRSPKTPPANDKPGSEPPSSTPATNPLASDSAAVVAEPPKTAGEEKGEDSDQSAGPALPVNIPAAVALRNRQAIARSLRPLMRKVASKQRQAIDEEATVIQIAETQTWSPVVQPEPERWLELAIVIEVTNLLDVWQDTIAEFQQLMERHGAFRTVRTWQLKPNAAGDPQLFLQTAAGLRSSPRSPRELLDAGGRRLILLLSDCTSRAWRSGKIPQLLELWSRENPVTIVQLLPEHYWDRSALKASYPVALRSRRPGALSRDWAIDGLSSRRRQRLPEGLKVPVVTMQPESFGQWARAIAAIDEQRTTGIVLNSRVFPTQDSTPQPTPLTAKQLVQQFRNTASDKAQELADMMAVLPVNWSVIRLIQKNLIQESAAPWQQTGALYLAEIFLSGLLRPVSLEAEPSQKRQKAPQYDFVDGVRNVLLGTIPISEAQAVGEEVAEAVFNQLPPEVQQRVNADIERRFGDSLSYFEAFLTPNLPWGKDAAAEIFPFARVTRQVLQLWGGGYAALADEIEHQARDSNQIDEEVSAYAYTALNAHLDYFQREILNTFIQQEHDFRLNHHPREMEDVEGVSLAEGGISVEVIDCHLIEVSDAEIGYKSTVISEPYSSFELYVRINFSVEIRYFDYEAYHPTLEENVPTFGEVVPNQTVQAIAAINLLFSGMDEVEPELVDLRVEEPIWIDLDQHLEVVVSTPPLQTFEFEVATIVIASEIEMGIRTGMEIGAQNSAISLQPFEFEMATISGRFPSKPDTQSQINALDEVVFPLLNRHWNANERMVLRGALENQTYDQISQKHNQTPASLKSVGREVWKLLSSALSVKVMKTNLLVEVEQWLWQRSIQREQKQAHQFIEDLGNGIPLEMVAIPGGSFLMGSPENEPQRYDNENPQHLVTVPPFLIGKYAITQAQCEAVIGINPARFKGNNRPVENVSWEDAIAFCTQLSQKTGRPYRLPSEAEWEYACRANPIASAGSFRAGDPVGNETVTPFHFGETITTDLANYDGNYTYGQAPKGIYREETTPVGSFPANAFGLHDMHGNVWEWCQDHWHRNYEGAPTDGSAWINSEAKDNVSRLRRGGSWASYPRNCRSARRGNHNPDYLSNDDGFRVVCSA